MNNGRYIYSLKSRFNVTETGNKAQSILFLKRHNCRIPSTFILLARTLDEYRLYGNSIIEKLKKEIARLPDCKYAIRSSTNIEDSENHSFAGQFQTLTNIRGCDNILNAIVDVWKSVDSNGKGEYILKIAGPERPVKCAVMIQEMVDSIFSGVSFSLNPVTNLNEIIVEAVEGQGENLVQKGATPFRWRIKENLILEGPEDHPLLNIVKAVAKTTISLKKQFKKHVDIEWAYDGKEVYFLQIRSVTGTDEIQVYSNRMAREMLPGQIKPLVWSVNIPLVNGTWIQILSEITGILKTKPEDLAKSFYYRVYFNMATLGDLFMEFGLPAESLEFMMLSNKTKKPMFMPGFKILKHTFRIVRFLYTKLHFEQTYLKDYIILEKRYKFLQEKIRNCNYVEEYHDLFTELFYEGEKTAYLNIIVPLLMQFYNKRLKSKLAKINTDYDRLNFQLDFPELAEMTPMNLMNQIRQRFEALPDSVRNNFESYAKLKGKPEATHLLEEFEKFIEKFGHLSNSGTDFSVKKWQEDPEGLFNMIIETPFVAFNKQSVSFSGLSYSGIKYPGLKRLYRKAGKFKVYREQISSLYIFGYGLFRSLFLGLGKEFADRGIIDSPEDIFYLTKQEIDNVITGMGKTKSDNYTSEIILRKSEMEASRDLLLPTVIIGNQAPILEQGNIKNMKGVGTSSGTYRGKTKTIRKETDFKKVCSGDVLIIPFSDISWTPILVKAGAIVSESGGMLSHCSIIARELGIPALVSVENACSLKSDSDVTVDGSNGILTIHENE